MKQIDTITVHQFGSGLLVELIGTDEQGEIATESIEFDFVNAKDDTVIPREEISTVYEEKIRRALSEKGYSFDTADRASSS